MATLTVMQSSMSKPQLRAALELFDNNYKAFRATIPLKPKSVLVNLIKHAPGEVFIEVLSQLDGFDLMRCQKVNLFFRKTIKKSMLLQYIIALTKAHYVDSPHFTPRHHPDRQLISAPSSSIARMSLLHTHVHNWRRLAYTDVLHFKLPLGQCRELASGVLVSAVGRSITSVVLPSKLRGNVASSRHFQSSSTMGSGLTVKDFRVDVEPAQIALLPEEDLLVLFVFTPEYWEVNGHSIEDSQMLSIHFRSLSTGHPHPMASRPVIRVPVAAPDLRDTITGNVIALSYLAMDTNGFLGACLDVLDWKRGHMVAKTIFHSRPYLTKPIFLTPTLIMAPRLHPNPYPNLDGNSTLRGSSLTEELAVFSIAHDTFEHIVSFSLSNKADNFVNMGALPSSMVSLDASSPNTPSAPYATLPPPVVRIDDGMRVITIRQTIFSEHHDQQLVHYDITCPVYHFLSFVDHALQSSSSSATPPMLNFGIPELSHPPFSVPPVALGNHLPFARWAARNTHVTISRNPFRTLPSVYGSRTLQYKHVGGAMGPQSISADEGDSYGMLTMFDYRADLWFWSSDPLSPRQSADEPDLDMNMRRAMLKPGGLEEAENHGSALTMPALCVDREIPIEGGVLSNNRRPVARLFHDLECIVLVQGCTCHRCKDSQTVEFTVLSI